MKKIISFVVFFGIFVFSANGFSEGLDIRSELSEFQKFITAQNERLTEDLELTKYILIIGGAQEKAGLIEKYLVPLVENSKKNAAVIGEVLAKEKLMSKDIELGMANVMAALITLEAINNMYLKIVSEERENLKKAIEKFKKEKDNRST